MPILSAIRAGYLSLLLLSATQALAHDSWISRERLTDPASGEWCCNNNDCRAEKVREVAGGFLTEAGDVVPFARVLWRSKDGAWWRCRYLFTNATRCLIGPPPGS